MRYLVVISCLVTASASYADPPRYTRKANLKIDETLSARVRPAPRTTAPTTRPAISGTDVLRLEDSLGPVRREQEGLLVQLVRDTPDTDPEKPDYLLRLAEHYAYQHRLFRIRAVESALPARSR
jgi:hypothetical protein